MVTEKRNNKIRSNAFPCFVLGMKDSEFSGSVFHFPYLLVNWFAKRSLLVCCAAIVLKIFASSQVTFEKSPKRKNSYYRRLKRV